MQNALWYSSCTIVQTDSALTFGVSFRIRCSKTLNPQPM